MYKSHSINKLFRKTKWGKQENIHFSLTLNNYDQLPEEIPNKLPERMNFIIFKPEKGSCPHLQGYCQTPKKMRASQILDILGSGWTVRSCYKNANSIENLIYCSKEETAIGEITQFGIYREIKKEKDLRIVNWELFQSWIIITYSTFLEKYVNYQISENQFTLDQESIEKTQEKKDFENNFLESSQSFLFFFNLYNSTFPETSSYEFEITKYSKEEFKKSIPYKIYKTEIGDFKIKDLEKITNPILQKLNIQHDKIFRKEISLETLETLFTVNK